jgi:hypothetical protein
MATTDVHGFLKWAAGLSQFDVTFNDLLNLLEAKLGLAVLSRVLTAPPGGETGGERYIMPAGTLTGAWSGFAEDDVAIYQDGGWLAHAPTDGQVAWDLDAGEGLTFDAAGGGWLVTSADLSAFLESTDIDTVAKLNAIVSDGPLATVAQVNAAVVGLLDYKGGYNAATNSPDLDVSPSGVLKGDVYTVTAAGDFFTAAVRAGDMIVAEVDAASAEADWTIVESGEDEPVFEGTGYVGVNDQTGTTYELVLSDAGKLVTCSNASAVALTIPANASVAFAVGTRVDVLQKGAGQVTVGITSDTLNGNPKTNAQWEVVSLLKISATVWVVVGGVA